MTENKVVSRAGWRGRVEGCVRRGGESEKGGGQKVSLEFDHKTATGHTNHISQLQSPQRQGASGFGVAAFRWRRPGRSGASKSGSDARAAEDRRKEPSLFHMHQPS
jgi:hypothetical protein